MEVKDLSFKLSNVTVQNFLAVKRLDFTVIHGIVQAYKRTKSPFENQIYYRIREHIPLECCAEQWPKPSWHQHEDPMFKKKIQTRNLSGMYQCLFLSRYERSKYICYVKKWHWMDPIKTKFLWNNAVFIWVPGAHISSFTLYANQVEWIQTILRT